MHIDFSCLELVLELFADTQLLLGVVSLEGSLFTQLVLSALTTFVVGLTNLDF